jgi:hypothetical protein
MGADASGGLGRGSRAHPAAVFRRDRPHGPPGDRQRERRGTRPVPRAGAAGSPPPRGPAAGPGPVRRSRPGRRPPVRGRAAGDRAGPTVPLYSAASRGVGRPFDKAAAAVHRRPLQPPPRPPKGRGRGRSGTSLRAARPRRVRTAGAARRPHRGGWPPRGGWGRLSTAHLPSTRASAAYGPPPPQPRTRPWRGAQNRGRGVACVNRSCGKAAGGTPPAALSAAHWRISEPQLRKVRHFALGCCVQALGLQAVVSRKRGFLSVVVRVIPANSGLKLDVARVKQVREVVGFWPVRGPRPRRTKLTACDSFDGVDVAGRECVGADGA